jgi:hypothetical protein
LGEACLGKDCLGKGQLGEDCLGTDQLGKACLGKSSWEKIALVKVNWEKIALVQISLEKLVLVCSEERFNFWEKLAIAQAGEAFLGLIIIIGRSYPNVSRRNLPWLGFVLRRICHGDYA